MVQNPLNSTGKVLPADPHATPPAADWLNVSGFMVHVFNPITALGEEELPFGE